MGSFFIFIFFLLALLFFFLDVIDGLLVKLKLKVLLALANGVSLVDLCAVGELTVCLQAMCEKGGRRYSDAYSCFACSPACFLDIVLEDDVGLVVLEVAQADEDDVALVDPHLGKKKRRTQEP